MKSYPLIMPLKFAKITAYDKDYIYVDMTHHVTALAENGKCLFFYAIVDSASHNLLKRGF